jgi:hypothetical protein
MMLRRECEDALHDLDCRLVEFRGLLRHRYAASLIAPTCLIGFLERGVVNRSAAELKAELGFTSASEIDIEEFLRSYKGYYRFYPTLLPAEL